MAKTRTGSRSSGSASRSTSYNRPHVENDPKSSIRNVLKEISAMQLKMYRYKMRDMGKDVSNNPTIGIDFDKVLNDFYIGAKSLDRVIPSLRQLTQKIQWPIFFTSIQDLDLIKNWLTDNLAKKLGVSFEIIPDNTPSWHKVKSIGLTHNKLHCLFYLTKDLDIQDVNQTTLDDVVNKLEWKD